MALMFALIFLGNLYGLESFKFFAPKYEDARRNVFENTQSYVEGKRQEIAKLKYEYARSSDETEKAAIRAMVRQVSANLDLSKLSPELRNFVNQ